MKKAGSIIALIAGILGFFAAIVTLGIGGLGAAFEADNSHTIVAFGWGGVIYSLLVIIFGSIAIGSKYKIAGVMLLLSSVAGAIYGGSLVAILMVLAFIGSILSIAGTPKSDQGMSKGQVVVWLVILLGIGILTASIAKVATGDGPAEESTQADEVDVLENAVISKLEPVGELAEIYTFGSKFTDIQRENKTKEITGQVIQWKLPVYEVSKKHDGSYVIQTDDHIQLGFQHYNFIPTHVFIKPRDDHDRQFIESLKTGDAVHIKGVISGESLRFLEIKPAQLVYEKHDESQSPNSVEHDIEDHQVEEGNGNHTNHVEACIQRVHEQWQIQHQAAIDKWCEELAAEGIECRISAGQEAQTEENANTEIHNACMQDAKTGVPASLLN